MTSRPLAGVLFLENPNIRNARSWNDLSLSLIPLNRIPCDQTMHPWVMTGRTIPVYAHKAICGGRPHIFFCALWNFIKSALPFLIFSIMCDLHVNLKSMMTPRCLISCLNCMGCPYMYKGPGCMNVFTLFLWNMIVCNQMSK